LCLFAGGIYQLRIQFPDQYPEKPPRVRFITEMYHPNIFPDVSPFRKPVVDRSLVFERKRHSPSSLSASMNVQGSLCLDILQDKWKPVYTVGTILTSIQSLLTDPNNASPANPDAARLLASNPKEYKKRVRRLAEKSVEGS
jgi:ubiquitin-conjugating enzyme E2 A